MTINVLTIIGALAVACWFEFKFMPWLEGKR